MSATAEMRTGSIGSAYMTIACSTTTFSQTPEGSETVTRSLYVPADTVGSIVGAA